MRVLIADKMSDNAAQVLAARGLSVDIKTGLSADDLRAAVADYHAIVVRSSSQITADIIAAAPNLKVVGRAGIGVDNIDVAAATKAGVVVMNTPHGNSVTTAEHTLAMIFALARHIPAANQSTQSGKWEKTKFTGVELFGKTLGILGCGNIGALVAERAIGLKMKVVTYDPFLSDDKAERLGVTKMELADVLANSDMLTLHLPLNEQTRHIINADNLAICKKGVRIINCARGGLVDEEALKAALKSGHVAGAALDVFAVEPATENTLFGLDNVICTPHLGASTVEAQENVALQVAEQIADFLQSGAVAHAVNMPALSAEDARALRLYLRLVSDMGAFLGQLIAGDLERVKIEYFGELTGMRLPPLTTVALQALLAPHIESVNVVNAQLRAKERGIKIEEVRASDDSDYRNLVRLSVVTSKGERSVAGTLFGNTAPRLVAVDGIIIEASPSAHMLFLRNDDKPGFVGAVGQALGKHNINIASFNLGRANAGGQAVALIAVDSHVDAKVIKELSKLPLMLEVQAVSFPS